MVFTLSSALGSGVGVDVGLGVTDGTTAGLSGRRTKKIAAAIPTVIRVSSNALFTELSIPQDSLH